MRDESDLLLTLFLKLTERLGVLSTPIFDFVSVQELPVVAKLFVPSVRCPICCHAIDSDFRYCQRCGLKAR